MQHRGSERRRAQALMLGAALVMAHVLIPPPATAQVPVELVSKPRQSLVRANPPLPPPIQFPIQLVLDDDQHEITAGVGLAAARQFLWFNRFAHPGAFELEEIWVLFPATTNSPVGAAIQLVVYLDPDGDPTNGANLLAAYDETIGVIDDVTFSIYPISPPLAISGAGDVLVGVVDRSVVGGVSPPHQPAALDATANQGRSWVAAWTADPPNPPVLPPDDFITNVNGNFMIRAFGTAAVVSAIDVPALGGVGLGILVAALSLAGVVAVRWRRTLRDRV